MIHPTATSNVTRATALATVVAFGIGAATATSARSQDSDSWHPEWPTVAVTSIIEHTDLDAVRDGIRDGLTTAGFVPGESLNFHYESADADAAKAADIAERMAASSADVVVALTEPIARLVVAQITDRPVVLTSISAAQAKRVLSTTRGRNRNVAGIVLGQPLREQLELTRALSTSLTNIVVPFEPSLPGAAAIIETIDTLGRELRLPIQTLPITPHGDAGATLRPLLLDGVAIFLPDGAGLTTEIASIAALASERGIVFVAGAADAVAEGATATILHDPYTVGLQTAAAVSRILQGTKPREIAMQPARATYTIVNQPALELVPGIDQQRILDTADLIYQ